MTDHVTPEEARRRAEAVLALSDIERSPLGDWPNLVLSLAAQLEATQEALLVAWKYTARAGLSNDQHNELDSIAGVVNAAYEQVKP